MTNKAFRKAAIATLKSLREDGYELVIKLNASNEALRAELERIDAQLEAEQMALVEQRQQVYEADTETITTNDLPTLPELFDTADAVMSKPIYQEAPRVSFESFCDSLEAIPTNSQVRINARKVATDNLTGHTALCLGLIWTLLQLIIKLPQEVLGGAQRRFEGALMEHMPLTVELLIWIGDRARAIEPTKVMDAVFCLD